MKKPAQFPYKLDPVNRQTGQTPMETFRNLHFKKLIFEMKTKLWIQFKRLRQSLDENLGNLFNRQMATS